MSCFYIYICPVLYFLTRWVVPEQYNIPSFLIPSFVEGEYLKHFCEVSLLCLSSSHFVLFANNIHVCICVCNVLHTLYIVISMAIKMLPLNLWLVILIRNHNVSFPEVTKWLIEKRMHLPHHFACQFSWSSAVYY